MTTSMEEKFEALAGYSVCDVSDALLKLKVPGAGFIADLTLYSPGLFLHLGQIPIQFPIIAPATTVLFVPKDSPSNSTTPSSTTIPTNIPPGKHYVDLTPANTIMVLSQPPGQTCAVLGGIMALRMKVCGAKGVVVGGRVRDLGELRGVELPVWALGTSTVGTAMQAQPWAIDVPVTIQGITIYPGDIIFASAPDGVVSIPQAKLEEVLALLPVLKAQDEKVREQVAAGAGVGEAFAMWRK